MSKEELREAVHRQPFVPFRLILTTGETYDIRHPDLLFIGLRSVTIGVPKTPDGTYYYRQIHVDLLHLVGFEELPQSAAPSNGETNPS